MPLSYSSQPQLSLLSSLTSRIRPVLLHDGDSKAGEPIAAAEWAVARSRFNVQYGQSVSGGSIGGTGTGATQVGGANNLTWPARLSAMVADVAARVAAGQVVDMVLTIGTNDVSGAAGSTLTADQAVANIRKYQQAFHGAGGRILWLMAVDPRGTTATPAVASYNNLYRLYASLTPGVRFVDTTPFLLNPSMSLGLIGGTSNAAFTASNGGDALHCSAYGCFLKSFAVEQAFAGAYIQRPYLGLDASDYYDASNLRGNIVSKNYAVANSGSATGTGRTRATGGTDSLTLTGSASKSGTPPLGWTMQNTLSGTQVLSIAQVTTCPQLEAATGITGQYGVAFTLSGTPSADGSLQVFRYVLQADGGTTPLEQSVLFEASNVTGSFGFQLGRVNVTTSTNLGFLGKSGALAVTDQLPAITGLFNPTAIIVPTASGNCGLSFYPFVWKSGVACAGTLIMIGATLRLESALPAAA